MFSGDECVSGRNPLQGTELCAVVEFMYSLEHLFAVFGTVAFADRLERVAFNALPATMAPGWLVAPVRPAGQPGAVHDQPRTRLVHQRAGVEPVRPRAELRLLHGEHAPGLAQVRGARVDAQRGRRAGGGGLGAVRGVDDRPGRAGDGVGRHRLSLPRGDYGDRGGQPAGAVPSPPAGAGVGRRCVAARGERGATQPLDSRARCTVSSARGRHPRR